MQQYHNNFPISLIEERKKRATKMMHITSVDDHFYPTDGTFSVSIIGHTKRGYIVSFSKDNISCTCPDSTNRTYFKPVCKHMFFIIFLSKDNLDIFNNTICLKDLMNQVLIDRILGSILKIIEIKKEDLKNQIIRVIDPERDEECPICYYSFENTKLTKCNVCKHTFHITCVTNAWSHSNSSKGNCPFCRARSDVNKLLLDSNVDDAWSNFNFEIREEEDIVEPVEPVQVVQQAVPVEQLERVVVIQFEQDVEQADPAAIEPDVEFAVEQVEQVEQTELAAVESEIKPVALEQVEPAEVEQVEQTEQIEQFINIIYNDDDYDSNSRIQTYYSRVRSYITDYINYYINPYSFIEN